jgi:hypothetical protein
MSDRKGKVVRLIRGSGRKERAQSPLAGAARDELHALADIVGALGVATFEGYEADAGFAFVSDRLRVLATADGERLT